MSTLSLENEYTGAPGEAQLLLSQFWNRVADDVNATVNVDFKTQELPLARIKKIMKLDEDVKMISAEAPVLFAKAAEIFIAELTLRAWIHAEDNKRRTLQRNDIAMAIGKYDQFDFLIDIVPREEIRPARRSDEVVVKTVSGGSEQLQYFLQVPSGQQTQTPVIQQPVQLSSILSPQQNVNASAQQTVTQAAAPTPQHPSIQVYTQVVGANGEIQQIPIQLTQSQIQAIALQMQGKQPGQSIVIQTSPLDHQSQVDGASNVSNNTSHYSNTQPLFQMPMYIQHDNAEDDEGVEPEEEQTE